MFGSSWERAGAGRGRAGAEKDDTSTRCYTAFITALRGQAAAIRFCERVFAHSLHRGIDDAFAGLAMAVARTTALCAAYDRGCHFIVVRLAKFKQGRLAV